MVKYSSNSAKNFHDKDHSINIAAHNYELASCHHNGRGRSIKPTGNGTVNCVNDGDGRIKCASHTIYRRQINEFTNTGRRKDEKIR